MSRERVLGALRHLTDGLAPDDAGVRWLLDQLDALYGEITDEAAEAVRRVLAEAGARAVLAELTAPQASPEAVRAGAAQDAPGDAISPVDGSEAVPGPPDALGSVQEACVKRARTCLECGKDFEVNFRHATAHKFCSAACRSRHRHRTQAGSKAGTNTPAQPEAPPSERRGACLC